MPGSTNAIILAAGEAARLRPLTAQRPKGMLLVGGRPILQHFVEALREVGVKRAVLVVGAHAEKIQSFFKDGKDFGLAIEYAHQAEPTGTADAVRIAIPLIDPDKPALVLMGDNFVTADTIRPIATADPDALLAATARVQPGYDAPRLKGGALERLESIDKEGPESRVSTGILHASPKLIEALDASNEHDLPDVVNAYVKGGGKVQVVDAAGPWIDVTTPWDLLRLNELVLGTIQADGAAAVRAGVHIQGPVTIGANTTIAPTATLVGPVTIGDGCTIGDYTVVGPYVSIRNNTTVEAHCEVRRSILNNNVTLGSRSLVRGSVLDDGVLVGPGFACHEATTPQGLVGCVLGADSEIGPDARAASGALLEAESRVEAGGRVDGDH